MLQVADETLEAQAFIDNLSKLGTGFAFQLNYNIISKSARQEIRNAKNDDEALHVIRQVG